MSLVLADHYLVTDHLFGDASPARLARSNDLLRAQRLPDHLDPSPRARGYGSHFPEEFYRRRAFRIFPAFYCCWIVATVVDLAFHEFYWKGALTSFFYMMDYGRAFHTGELAYLHMWISWSLAIEEKFYLLWPLLLIFLLRKRSTMVRTMVLIILGLWTYRAVLYLGLGVRWDYVYSAFDMRADALLAGCLLAILVGTARPGWSAAGFCSGNG